MWILAGTLVSGVMLDQPRWRVINDTVMGGVSSAEVVPNPAGGIEFRGQLSLENNGGFTSTRTRVNADWSAFDHLRMRVVGDGREYLLTTRLRDSRRGRVYYRTPFRTKDGVETDVLIPFAALEAYAFGTPLPQAPRFMTQAESIGTVGVMLADKRPGAFSLKILELTPVSAPRAKMPPVDRNQALVTAFQQAIQEGVPLFNRGDKVRCYDVYRITVANVLLFAADLLEPAHRSVLSEALSRAKAQDSPGEQAWTIRTAMDAVLAGHRGGSLR